VDDNFSRGAYAYKTPETATALETITTPIEETLYFSGEAFSDGNEMGTVEAALSSATSVVDQILKTALHHTPKT
jgi:monoamine oxidase